VAPVVNGGSVSGKPGVPLAFNVTSSAVNPVSYAIANAPAGMTIAVTGVVTWPKPVTGTYAVTATVKDTKTALSGQGVYTVKIDAPPVAPVVAAATVNGKAGVALSVSVTVTAASATGFTLAGAPAGMTVSNAGVVSWASPVAGTYAVTVTATNSASGLSGKGILTVVIAKAQPPVITAAALKGVAGKPLSGSIGVSAPAGGALTVSIAGVPVGVTFSVSGQSLALYWAKPVAGKYSLSITARDANGLSAQASLPITIDAK
jgi:hypothetical protein